MTIERAALLRQRDAFPVSSAQWHQFNGQLRQLDAYIAARKQPLGSAARQAAETEYARLAAEYRQRVNTPGGFGTPAFAGPGLTEILTQAIGHILGAFRGAPNITTIPGLAPFRDILAETDPEQCSAQKRNLQTFIQSGV
jgi:hypothetical protein